MSTRLLSSTSEGSRQPLLPPTICLLTQEPMVKRALCHVLVVLLSGACSQDQPRFIIPHRSVAKVCQKREPSVPAVYLQQPCVIRCLFPVI